MNKFRDLLKCLQGRVRSLLNNQKLKDQLYTIIFEADTPAGKGFDVVLIWCILLSVFMVVLDSYQSIPARFNTFFLVGEYLFTIFFTLEYVVRIYCSPKPKKYIFSFFGIVDLLSTLPLYLVLLFPGIRYLLMIRAFRLIRVFRVYKMFSFLYEGEMLLQSIKQSRRKLMVFFFFVVLLVISIGTLMYMIEGNLEESRFNNIPNCIYWAIVTMTTVGYGDITPVTPMGRLLSAFVMLMGYTIIAIPTGIVSVSMVNEVRNKKSPQLRCDACGKVEEDAKAQYCKYCGAKVVAIDQVDPMS